MATRQAEVIIDAMWWAVDTLDEVLGKIESALEDEQEFKDETLSTCDRLRNLRSMLTETATSAGSALERMEPKS